MESILISLVSMVVAVGCMFLFTRYRLNNVADNKDLAAEVDREIVKMKKVNPEAGIVVGVYKEGRSYFKSQGHFSDDNRELPDEHSVFQIGSLSKLFTAAILHSMIKKGNVSLDSTLDELIGKKYKLSDDAKTVTLHQLVTHTSGFPRVPQVFVDDLTAKVGKENVLKDPYGDLKFKDIANYLKTSEGKKPPGKFDYSNFGSGLLGHVLAIVSGKDLGTLAQENLFQPLGMKQTGIKPSAETQKLMPQGHNPQGEAVGLWKFGALEGAGAFYSTASDMLIFLTSYLDDTHTTPLSADGGWMPVGKLENMFGNTTMQWHNGKVGGYSSYAAVDKIHGTAAVVLSAKADDLTMSGIMLMRHSRTQSWKV